jgi:hypothetical protein
MYGRKSVHVAFSLGLSTLCSRWLRLLLQQQHKPVSVVACSVCAVSALHVAKTFGKDAVQHLKPLGEFFQTCSYGTADSTSTGKNSCVASHYLADLALRMAQHQQYSALNALLSTLAYAGGHT